MRRILRLAMQHQQQQSPVKRGEPFRREIQWRRADRPERVRIRKQSELNAIFLILWDIPNDQMPPQLFRKPGRSLRPCRSPLFKVCPEHVPVNSSGRFKETLEAEVMEQERFTKGRE